MKIALVFDGASALGKDPDLNILGTIEAIEAVLAAEGNDVVRLSAHTDGRWVERLRRMKPDLVFNLCEGIDGVAALEASVISALEVLDVPFTGNASWTTSLCLRKHVVNALLDRAGLPIPRFAVVRRGGTVPSVGFPAIAKPAAEDASIGVEQRSVARSARTLAERVSAMHERWDEVLVQRYIDGREVNVGILGDEVLPISEIDFSASPKGMWRIVSYRAKWDVGSEEDVGTRPVCPAKLSRALTAELERIARAAWRIVGGEGYGRVDFRIDRTGRPWLLEVNPNPDIAPDAGLARMAGVAGMDYGALIRAVCDLALERSREPEEDRWALAERLSGILGRDATAMELFAVGQQ
jgi:D-alanine-D-alanine ligase